MSFDQTVLMGRFVKELPPDEYKYGAFGFH
jgi:hypothetical protein